MQEKIDVHTQRMVEIVKNVGQQTVVNLRKAENEGLEKMDTFIDTLEEKIDKLQLLSEKNIRNSYGQTSTYNFLVN